MMGRLLCPEKSEPGRKAEDTSSYHPSHAHPMSTNIPLQQQNAAVFPPISPVYLRPLPLNPRPVSSFADMPPLQERSHSSFQEPLSTQSDIKEVRSSAVSPNLKLPPIYPSKASSAPEVVSLPSQSNLNAHSSASNDANAKRPSLKDMRLAYENMMVSYFMPQSAKSENSSVPENIEVRHIPNQQNHDGTQPSFSAAYASHPMSSVQHLMQPCSENYMDSQTVIPDDGYALHDILISSEKSLNPTNSAAYVHPVQIPLSSTGTQHTSRDVTSSGCTLLDGMNFSDYQQQSLVSLQTNEILKSDNNFNSDTLTDMPSMQENMVQSDSNEQQPPLMVNVDQNTNITDMSAVLNELSMFMSPSDNNITDTAFPSANTTRTFSTTTVTTNVSTCTTTVSSSVNYYQSKSDPTWGRYSVLPPVMPNAASTGGCISDSDNISLMSYNSIPSNAQSNSQMGMYYASFSPFSVNFTDNLPSTFASSPRYSGRSSYTGRGSRNKRALSNSPLSAEGIDLNTIIRMSPTSLVAYINGSRSSSSCVSPGSIGERNGCYGHLSARNSSSSPHSGSNSSGNRRSTSYTPQTSTPSMSNSRSTLSNIASDNSNASAICTEPSKTDTFPGIDDNLLVIQAMQDLEGGVTIPGNAPLTYNNNIMHPSQIISDCEFQNLQVLPQDIAAFRTEDLLSFMPTMLPQVHTHVQPQFQPQASQPLHNITQHCKPPPTYDQHMARKATLQKNSSSESSSQPSNSSSFESSEGDKTVAGNSSTDTEGNRMFACRWLDCTAVFQDQDEFVSHIEKVHVDQKRGEDFICYWKLCPRRLHPFNARYKLLVHMRVHSGDKPNKCTYAGCKKAFSRLENLKIHLRSHTGERPYSCTFTGCTKTFSNSSDRTKHQKTHHDTKPYVCQVKGCGKRYTDPSSLRKHVKKSHPEKKEPDRKKIRGVEELDPQDVNECLMIQAIKPITLCDASPPEPVDSGLGRSPRGSQPASSSDHYPSLIYDSLCRSDTAQGSSCHTSPSSHHSSPPSLTDRDKIPPNNNSLRVPILPPIVPSPTSQVHGFPSQNQISNTRPTSKTAPRQQASAISSLESGVPVRNSNVLLQGTRNPHDISGSRLSDMYSPSMDPNYKSTPLPFSNVLKHHSRENS